MSDRSGDMPDRGLPPIPQASPGREVAAIRAELDAAIAGVLDSGRYILGPQVEAFEAEMAAYLGLREAIGVASGTDAIELALRGLGVGSGDAVYTVSHTAVATVAAIERTGAVAVLVDTDDATLTLDPDQLARAIEADARPGGARPRVVIPVHLYGHPAPMPAILEGARRSGLLVLEDCAQAHGALLDGRMAGTFGDVAAFSFYPTKNLGAIGDGGLVATDDPVIAARIRELRQYGWRERYVSGVPGFNSRLDELQAALLRVKLRYLEAGNARRRVIAGRYDAALGTLDGGPRIPAVGAGVQHVYHQYVVRSPRRDALAATLAAEGIGTAVHYPVPVHMQPAYRGRVPVPVPLAVTERAATEILSLPMFPSLSDAEVDRVGAAVARWAASAREARSGR